VVGLRGVGGSGGFGFLVGGASSQLVASLANAQDLLVPPAISSTTQKWDYLCLKRDHKVSLTDPAKAAGREGWELVTVTSYERQMHAAVFCFKRPM